MRNLSRLIVVALAAIVDLLIVVHNKAIDFRVAVLNAVIRDAQIKTAGALRQIDEDRKLADKLVAEARKLADAIVADAVAHAQDTAIEGGKIEYQAHCELRYDTPAKR